MKVKISQLEPNPFRDMKNYPIDSAKIEALGRSIDQTGFWDNILARKHDGKIQIAYGHHRLIALRKVMKPTDEVDIPIKPLDDATMLKIMANENMDEWRTNPAVIRETVEVARRFLKEHPDEARKYGQVKSSGTQEDLIIGAPIIARFLGWKEYLVTEALARVNNPNLDKEAERKMPTVFTAHKFATAVKQFKPTPAQQKKAAAKITKTEDFSEAGIRGAITEQIYRKPKAEHKDFKLIELREEIKATEKLARDLSSKLLTLTRFREEIKDQVYRAEVRALATEFNVLIQALKSFIGEKNNVKQLKG